MPYKPIDLARLRTLSLAERPSKVRVEDFARPARPEASFAEFFDSLRRILFGEDVRAVVEATCSRHVVARAGDRPCSSPGPSPKREFPSAGRSTRAMRIAR